MDINKIPKQFCDNITVAFGREFFAMGMHTGENGIMYALTPEHMKRLSQNLSHQVAEYEKNFGSINAEWKPGVESPIQTRDVT
jgi:hypothetical protein